MEGYAALTVASLRSELTYRGQTWIGIASQILQLFAKVAIWTSTFALIGNAINNITVADMITYAIFSAAVISAWDYEDFILEVGALIRSGDISQILILPVAFPLHCFSVQLGRMLARVVFVVAPSALVTALLFGVSPPSNPIELIVALILSLNGFVLLFLMSMVCALLSFWLMTAYSIQRLLQSLLALLSGSFLPLWFFPSGLASVVGVTPFPWVGYYPVATYLGKFPLEQSILFLVGGLTWSLIFGVAVVLLWRRARLRIVVQGG